MVQDSQRLIRLMHDLRHQRAAHKDAVREIDITLASLGRKARKQHGRAGAVTPLRRPLGQRVSGVKAETLACLTKTPQSIETIRAKVSRRLGHDVEVNVQLSQLKRAGKAKIAKRGHWVKA